MNAPFLESKHSAGLLYEQYIQSGTDQQYEDWKAIYDQSALTDRQKQLLGSFERKMNVIALSGIWCGDCVQQGPLVARIAEAAPQSILLRWLDRGQHLDLQAQVAINAGHRVPVLIFCAQDFELVSWYGNRTLHRYRAVAQQQLGPSCPMPGAAVPDQQQHETLQDWLDQFERVHLLLRLSTRLRQLQGD